MGPHEDEDRDTNSATNQQSPTPNALEDEIQDGQYNKAVCITVHSVRKRLTDSDGVSSKAAIDGIVEAGLLKDDSPKEVKEVRHSQEQGSEEKTIITLEAIER